MYVGWSSTSESEEEEEAEVGACPTRIGVSDKAEKRIKGFYALYPEFLGVSGPVNKVNPSEHDALDFLRLVWGREVCELISVETREQ